MDFHYASTYMAAHDDHKAPAISAHTYSTTNVATSGYFSVDFWPYGVDVISATNNSGTLASEVSKSGHIRL